MMKAIKIKDLSCTGARIAGMTSDHSQALFRMDPPLDGHRYVVASCVSVMGTPETYLFGADADGKITDWSELDGSLRGVLDHGVALAGAGYEVVDRDPA